MYNYTVYLIESLGATLNHQAIFVETKADGSGEVFHVKGNIQEGMSYEAKSTPEAPDKSIEFISKTVIGRVNVENLNLFKSICSANPPPEKQFNGPKRINKDKPLRRCQEWASETIAQLKAQGILESTEWTHTVAGSFSTIESTSGGQASTRFCHIVRPFRGIWSHAVYRIVTFTGLLFSLVVIWLINFIVFKLFFSSSSIRFKI